MGPSYRTWSVKNPTKICCLIKRIRYCLTDDFPTISSGLITGVTKFNTGRLFSIGCSKSSAISELEKPASPKVRNDFFETTFFRTGHIIKQQRFRADGNSFLNLTQSPNISGKKRQQFSGLQYAFFNWLI